jgi:septal ring factor EnvC (AmiA/AmiB activator)|tara:strand:+ start:523 stop:777 length:255 start_codon:yes stop_codon:yes gene_type:complete
MPDNPTMIWNAILSLACGSFIWWVRGMGVQINDLKRRISDTREEMAKEYATKDDVEKDLERIMDRFDKLEAKMDNFLERLTRNA